MGEEGPQGKKESIGKDVGKFHNAVYHEVIFFCHLVYNSSVVTQHIETNIPATFAIK